MNKKRALVCISMAVLFSGCAEESPQPVASTPPTVAATPVLKPVMAVTPAVPPIATPVWDAPVDGRPVFMKVRAEGVQIYQCKKNAKGAFMWALVAPEALLYNDKGRAVGKHGAGPSWELSDGSRVTAEKIASMPQGNAIPLLLLKTISTNGTGKLAAVKYIKRIETDGGTSPALPADAAHEGKEERIPYRATYVFYAGT